MNKECNHEWVEDEMMASGAIMMISGSVDDLGEETRVICKKCNVVDFVPKNFLNRVNLIVDDK